MRRVCPVPVRGRQGQRRGSACTAPWSCRGHARRRPEEDQGGGQANHAPARRRGGAGHAHIPVNGACRSPRPVFVGRRRRILRCASVKGKHGDFHLTIAYINRIATAVPPYDIHEAFRDYATIARPPCSSALRTGRESNTATPSSAPILPRTALFWIPTDFTAGGVFPERRNGCAGLSDMPRN